MSATEIKQLLDPSQWINPLVGDFIVTDFEPRSVISARISFSFNDARHHFGISKNRRLKTLVVIRELAFEEFWVSIIFDRPVTIAEDLFVRALARSFPKHDWFARSPLVIRALSKRDFKIYLSKQGRLEIDTDLSTFGGRRQITRAKPIRPRVTRLISRISLKRPPRRKKSDV